MHAVVEAIPPSEEHALVMKSTVPCGTGAALQRSFRERGKGGLGYVSCPEFLREGSAVHDFMHPDRVVVGIDEHDSWAGDAVVELYASLGVPLVRTDIASAEMVKLASNAFLATKISFINEIANVCEETGADVVEVARGMGLDPRIGPRFLQAGIGYGGSCFPKDVNALKQLAGNSGYHFQLLTAVIEVNELQKRRVIAKLHKHLGGLAGRRVALFGLAFKPETDDMRDASSLVLAARLNADGARVVAYDPVAEEQARRMVSGIEFAGSALEAVPFVRRQLPAEVRRRRRLVAIADHSLLIALAVIFLLPVVFFHTRFLTHWGGWLTTIVAALFLAVYLSGWWGLLVQQWLPRRLLQSIPHETIYSQIPALTKHLREEAELLVLMTCGPKPGSDGRPLPPDEVISDELQSVVKAARKSSGAGLLKGKQPEPVPGAQLLWTAYDQDIKSIHARQ